MLESITAGKAESLGVATFCLGCVVALTSIGTATPSSNDAARLFAVALPLSVMAWFLEVLRDRAAHPPVNTVLRFAGFASFAVAQLTAVAGVYYLFDHVSTDSGRAFLKTSALCYLLLAVVMPIVGETNRKRNG